VHHTTQSPGLPREYGAGRRAGVDRGPNAGIGRDRLSRRVAHRHAHPILESVLAIPIGHHGAILQQESLRHTHVGTGLAIHVADVSLGTVELLHVDVADRSGPRILVLGRAREGIGRRYPEVAVVQLAEVIDVVPVVHRVGAILRSRIEGSSARQLRAFEPILLQNLAARLVSAISPSPATRRFTQSR
jgi:hypothetical protein